ncbi:hypothetical protein FOCC_FOCC011855, partial [Frankliniella occidentalis]
MFDIQRKYLTGMQLVRKFTGSEWRFRTEGMAELAARMSPADREDFYFDPANYTWSEYLERCVLGVREHYHKEKLDTLPRATTQLRISPPLPPLPSCSFLYRFELGLAASQSGKERVYFCRLGPPRHLPSPAWQKEGYSVYPEEGPECSAVQCSSVSSRRVCAVSTVPIAPFPVPSTRFEGAAMPSAVADFYKGADVLVTGATGFVGVALLEKLLRGCPDVGNIYCLMRPKRGKDISVFEKLIEKQGSDVFKKIIPVAGEIGEENLGLSPEDRKTLQANVQVAFHCAATLDFEANLKTTVTINLLGTRRIVELCSGMKKLKALVHVSSAYVNSNLKVQVDEKLYPVPDSADKIIEMASSLSDAALEEATPKVLGNHPNTYTFTKALAEHEVAKGYEKFPAVVVRPSMS